jgi:hypothetical protein
VFFGDKAIGRRTESPFENYGIRSSKDESVQFYKISNIQVTTIPSLIVE